MQIYRVLVTRTSHGYLAKQTDFDVAIDADTLEHAITAMKDQIEQIGALMMRNGEAVPKDALTELPTDWLSEGVLSIYVQVDIEKRFRDSATESVRKNISMPAWMDIQLRYYGVDASKMFQEAAQAFLDSKEKKEVVCQTISTVDELIENVDADILNQYVMKRLFK